MKNKDAKIPLSIEGLVHLEHATLVEVAHRMDLEDLMVALTHAPKNLKERMVGAMDKTRRAEFLNLVQGLQVTLETSLERQELLLGTAEAVQATNLEQPSSTIQVKKA